MKLNKIFIFLLVLLSLIGGVNALSIGNFTSSDFTMTNTELVSGNIQMTVNSTNSILINNPFYNGHFVINSYLTTRNDFCIYSGYTSYISTTTDYSAGSGNSVWYSNNGNWAYYGLWYKLLSITCSVNNYQTSGSMVQTTPTTTTEQYDTLTLDYNQTLNGGIITPTLIVNGVETSLTNKVLTGSFPVGTNVSVKFSFTGSTSTTPQLNNNIVLSGSYPTIINSDTKPYYNSNKINISLNTSTNTNMSYSLDSGLETSICNNCNITTLNLNSLNESLHNIIFISTDSSGQVNTSVNFTIDTIYPTINNNILSEYNFYNNINLNSSCSDSNLDYCNISINSQNFKLSNNFNSTLNGNLSYTITAKDLAGNQVTQNGITLINPYQYFYFYDTARALNIENYTFGNYNSSNKYISIPIYDLGLGNHSLLFSKFGYGLSNFSFNFNSSSKLNQTFNPNPVTLTLKVYDENSPTTQLTFNLSLNNVSNYTQYLNQLNFQKYYNETLNGKLSLTIENSAYSLRKIFSELNPYTTVSQIIYLLKNIDSTPVIFRTMNLAKTQAIQDVVFTFKKNINGVPTTLGQAKTDSQGYTYFNMDLLKDYEITISKNGYITQIIKSIPGKSNYEVLMENAGNSNVFLYDQFSYLITPKNKVSTLPFNVSAFTFDQSNLISSMRFSITGDNFSKTQVITSPSGGTINFEITNSSPQYILNLTVMRDGQEYNYINKLNYYAAINTNTTIKKVANSLNGKSNNEDRVFLILIIYIIAVVLGSLFSPAAGALFGLLPITIFVYADWLSVGIGALFYLFTILGVLYFER